MNVEEIKQAISELSPVELAQLRRWFEEFENKRANNEPIEKRLARLRGSLRGSGLLKAYMEEKKNEKELEL